MRSPTAVFKYLGKLLREGTGDRIVFYTGEARHLQGRFLEIVPASPIIDCFVAVAYNGGSYCVPQWAYTTAMMFEILEQLRNLSISPTDLNSAFTVRVI